MCYSCGMIRGFGDPVTRDFASGKKSARMRRIPPDVRATATRKLVQLETADNLDNLRIPPGNHLKSLKGDLAGFYSIRINAQWRMIFRWIDGGAEDVSIVDYHE